MNNLISAPREQREQREQVNIGNDYSRSQPDDKLENSGNKLITKIEVPLDTPPKKLQKPKIKRPCYMTHAANHCNNGTHLGEHAYNIKSSDTWENNAPKPNYHICVT